MLNFHPAVDNTAKTPIFDPATTKNTHAMTTETIQKGQRIIAKNGKTYVAMFDSFFSEERGCEYFFGQPINAKTGKPWQAGREFKVSEVSVAPVV